MSGVDQLIPSLEVEPVLYMSTQSAGVAYFHFSFFADSYSGSHASVTFDVGEASKKVLGPFALGMEFAKNLSATPMFYSYTSSGTWSTFWCRTHLDRRILA